MSIVYRRHHLYPESVLIREFSGEVGVQEIIASWQYLIDEKLIDPAVKGVVNNLLGCDLKMDLDSFEQLIGYMKSREALRHIRIAAVTDNPRVAVFPTLGEMEVKELKIRLFSTLEPAVAWVINW